MSLTDNELIELRWISQTINVLLGTDFRVWTNAVTEIHDDSRIDVLLQAERIPFSVTGINSESLSLTLEIYAPSDTQEQQNRVLKGLNAIIGHKDGTITTDVDGQSYNFASFLEFRRPAMPPTIASGKLKHLLNITGTMLVSDAKQGAVISNHVFTKISFREGGVDYSEFIPTLRIETDLNFATETDLTGNYNTIGITHNARGVNLSLTALILNRAFDRALIDVVHMSNDSDLNRAMEVERLFPNKTIKKSYRLISAGLVEEAGAFISYRLGLQEVK